MPAGFRGTHVRVASIALGSGRGVGPTLKFTVQFADQDGVVYAYTQHEVDPSSIPRAKAAAHELVEAIKEWTENTHFQEPTTRKVTPRGIAESLQERSDLSDELEEQG
jgi:hypothetical protein